MRMVYRSVLVLLLVVFCSTAWAGIGIHVGMDMSPIEGESTTFAFPDDPIDYAAPRIERVESGKPLNFGLDYTFGMIPKIDLIVGFTAAFSAYDVVFDPDVDTQPIVEETLPYMRSGLEVSALYDIVGFPPAVKIVNVFAGGGLGLHMFTPIVSKDLLLDNISSADEEVKLGDLVEIGAKLGIHLIGGVKIKPTGVPIGLRLMAKYYIITGQDDPAPSSFLNASAGIYFGF